ncbi:MAG: hypothetical protein KatS3mg059_0373 [Thermomicrobiales bacterium]|nr:MAG: hypothetical protein KatS3mg059_0373 [Thermomicrobiales bacterium]
MVSLVPSGARERGLSPRAAGREPDTSLRVDGAWLSPLAGAYPGGEPWPERSEGAGLEARVHKDSRSRPARQLAPRYPGLPPMNLPA